MCGYYNRLTLFSSKEICVWGLVSFAIFLIVALDVEHPPAVGTALAVAINSVRLTDAVVIMVSALLITQCRHLMKTLLKDLL